MKPKQVEQFNRMLTALKRIKNYQTPEQLRRNSEKDYGVEYVDALEMAYENILQEAKMGALRIRPASNGQ